MERRQGDSYLALRRAAGGFDVQALVTMFTEDGTRSRSHGLCPEVVARQARLLNLPLVSGRGSWKTYEEEFKRVLRVLEMAFPMSYSGTSSSMSTRCGSSGSVTSAA